jgi:predicted TIM-barrel fold metal-dependent hydrolase
MDLERHIDAHSHVWTPVVDHYPLASGFAVADMNPKSFTAEELLAICRPCGVGRVNLIQMSYYEFDNSYLLDVIKSFPDRFVGTAIVDPLGPDPAKAMADLRPKGVRAFRIQPKYGKQPADTWLRPDGYKAMFSKAGELGLVLSCLIDPDGLPEVDRMCRAYPKTPVVIDHLARIGVDGSFRDADIAALCGLAKHPHVYVKVGAFYALGARQAPFLDLAPLIQRVLGAYGANRLMWESDCPFQVENHSYESSISLVRDRLDFLSDEDRQWMLAGTAQKLLFTVA